MEGRSRLAEYLAHFNVFTEWDLCGMSLNKISHRAPVMNVTGEKTAAVIEYGSSLSGNLEAP